MTWILFIFFFPFSKFFRPKTKVVVSGEMAQSVKCLPCKYLSLIPRVHIKPGPGGMCLYPRTGLAGAEAETGRFLILAG